VAPRFGPIGSKIGSSQAYFFFLDGATFDLSFGHMSSISKCAAGLISFNSSASEQMLVSSNLICASFKYIQLVDALPQFSNVKDRHREFTAQSLRIVIGTQKEHRARRRSAAMAAVDPAQHAHNPQAGARRHSSVSNRHLGREVGSLRGLGRRAPCFANRPIVFATATSAL